MPEYEPITREDAIKQLRIVRRLLVEKDKRIEILITEKCEIYTSLTKAWDALNKAHRLLNGEKNIKVYYINKLAKENYGNKHGNGNKPDNRYIDIPPTLGR